MALNERFPKRAIGMVLLSKLDRAMLGYILLAQKAARGLLSALPTDISHPRRDT